MATPNIGIESTARVKRGGGFVYFRWPEVLKDTAGNCKISDESGCVNTLIYSSCGTRFEDDVGTRRTWSSFSSLNFLPVFKHKALCPRMAKTCGGIERPLKYSARLCLRSGPSSRWTFMRMGCSLPQSTHWTKTSYAGITCFLSLRRSNSKLTRLICEKLTMMSPQCSFERPGATR